MKEAPVRGVTDGGNTGHSVPFLVIGGCGVALLGNVIITVAQLHLAQVDAPLFSFFFWTLIVARFGPLSAALLSAISAAALGNYFFLDTSGEFTLNGTAAYQTVLFACMSTATAVMMHTIKHQMAIDRQARAKVEVLAQSLHAALRARDDFLLVASHELRTPLTVAMLQAGTFVRHVNRAPSEVRDPKLGRIGTRLLGSLDRLARLIEEILDMSRISNGGFNLKLETLEMAVLLNEAVVHFKEITTQDSLNIRLDVQGQAWGRWDRYRVEQVLTNLLTNACKYGASKPIFVRMRVDEEHVHVSVIDQGIGVADADQKRIFERYERAVDARDIPGFGLGLWLSRSLAEAMGGTLSIQSKISEGSTFTLTLPLEATRADRTYTEGKSGGSSAAADHTSDGQAPEHHP